MFKTTKKLILVIILLTALSAGNSVFAAVSAPMSQIAASNNSVLFKISSAEQIVITDLWCVDKDNNKLSDCTLANSLVLNGKNSTDTLLQLNYLDDTKDHYLVLLGDSPSPFAPKQFSLAKTVDESSINDVKIKKIVKLFEEGKSLNEINQEIASTNNSDNSTKVENTAPIVNDGKVNNGVDGFDAINEPEFKKGDKFDLLGRLSINKTFLYVDISLLILVLLLEFIHLVKSNRGWGMVFDGKSKKPLQGAVVRIFKEEQNKILETKVTDDLGRFNFLVKQGSYYLEVVKEGFRYPSKLITKKNDEFYSNMYRGEVLKIFRNNASLSLSVPLDPVGESSEGIEQELKKMSNFWLKAKHFFIHNLRLGLLYLLTLLHIGVILLNYTTPLITAIVLVAIVWLLEIYSILAKGYR